MVAAPPSFTTIASNPESVKFAMSTVFPTTVALLTTPDDRTTISPDVSIQTFTYTNKFADIDMMQIYAISFNYLMFG